MGKRGTSVESVHYGKKRKGGACNRITKGIPTEEIEEGKRRRRRSSSIRGGATKGIARRMEEKSGTCLMTEGVRATRAQDFRRILSYITVCDYDTTYLQENP